MGFQHEILDKNQQKSFIYKTFKRYPYYNSTVNPSYNTSCFHIKISLSVSMILLHCYCLQDTGKYA